MRTIAALLLTSIAAACASPPPEVVRAEIRGTRVTIAVAPGFSVSKQFPGLVNPEALASVMISEIPRPPDRVRAEMTPEALASRGAELLHSEEVSVDGRAGWLYHLSAGATSDRGTLRWILVTGEGENSAVIAATAPRSHEKWLGPVLRDTLLSAAWDPERVLGPWDGLGFRLEEGGTLKLSERLPRMVALTKGGHRGALAPHEALFLAGSSAAASVVTDLAEFAHEQLRVTAELTDITVLAESLLSLDGLPAHESLASATDSKSGTPLRIYQMLVVDGAEYFLLQGMVGASDADAFVPEFTAIARSFRRTP